jgi:hypothetical protein
VSTGSIISNTPKHRNAGTPTRFCPNRSFKIIVQLFVVLLCPVIETQPIDMKNNIIYFGVPEQQREEGKDKGGWIRIENAGACTLIDTLVVVWLCAWSLVASVEFLRVTGTVLF